MKEKIQYGLLPRFKKMDSGSIMMQAVVVRRYDDSVRNCTSMQGWEGLRFLLWYYNDDQRFSRPDIGYGDRYFIGLREMEAMVKKLRSIKRKLEQFAKLFGHMPSTEECLMRVCRAMGVDFIARQIDDRPSADYDAHSWEFMSITDGVEWIEHQMTVASQVGDPVVID